MSKKSEYDNIYLVYKKGEDIMKEELLEEASMETKEDEKNIDENAAENKNDSLNSYPKK